MFPLPLPACLLAVALLFAATAPAPAHDDPDRQLEDLNLRIAGQPGSAALLLERAELQRFRREWAAGVADLQEASRLDPSMAAVDLAMASLLLDAGNLGPALDAADRFLGRKPQSVSGHLTRARILYRSGRGPECADEVSRAVALDRERRRNSAAASPADSDSGIQPDDHLMRARALHDAGRTDDAVAALDEGLADLGQPVSLQLFAIELEQKRGRSDLAVARVERLEAAARRKEAWMARRGDLLAAQGKHVEAAAAWRQARAAIAALPPRLRDGTTTRELEQELRARLREAGPAAGNAAAPVPVARLETRGE